MCGDTTQGGCWRSGHQSQLWKKMPCFDDARAQPASQLPRSCSQLSIQPSSRFPRGRWVKPGSWSSWIIWLEFKISTTTLVYKYVYIYIMCIYINILYIYIYTYIYTYTYISWIMDYYGINHFSNHPKCVFVAHPKNVFNRKRSLQYAMGQQKIGSNLAISSPERRITAGKHSVGFVWKWGIFPMK